MRTRRVVWTGSLFLVGLMATAVAFTARGQDQPVVAEPKYYQGKVSPPPAGLFPGTGVRAPTTPVTGKSPYVPPPVPGKAQPRFTQPVVAGPDGVRQASASELPAPVIPPASGNDGSMLSPPKVSVESAPPAMLPFGTPPTLDLPGLTPPSVSGMPAPPAVSRPIFQEQAAPLLPPGTQLPARQAPSVTIDAVVPETVSVGQPMTYELVVRNVGTSPLLNVRVDDELPARAAFVVSDPVAEATGDRLAWTLGTMEPGIERRIKVTVKPADEGEVRSRAIVSFASAVEVKTKVTRPRVTVAMTGPDIVRVGDKVTFQIKLANTGTGTAGKVALQAKFGDGFSHPQGNVIEAELAGLPVGQTKTLNLEAIAAKAGAHTCTLSVIADANPAELVKSQVTLVEPLLQLKQAGPTRCLVRGEPVFQIELSNPGSAATDPVTVWASLPPGFDFVQATDGGAFTESSRAISWRLPSLPAGGTKTVSLKVRAMTPTDGVIRTVAVAANEPPVQQAGAGIETRAAVKGLEARTETAVKAEGIAALRFEVSDVEDPVEVGKEAIYEIKVMNQGTGPCTGVQVIAEMADGTSAVSATGPTTGRAVGAQQVSFDPIPTLSVKGEAVYRVRVLATVPGDHRFRVKLVCDQVKVPVVKEENTRFFKE